MWSEMGLIRKILVELIMLFCSIVYKFEGKPLMYIKGHEEKYPRYLLYTEDVNVYDRMDKF